MTKEEVVAVMVAKFNEVNKNMALMSGMSEEEADGFIEQSTPSIEHSMIAVYDALAEQNIVQ